MDSQTANKNMIGVTERGDAGTDFSWFEKLKRDRWAGAVLITKRMSPEFNKLVLACEKPVIVHCTCTGNGGTWVEPAAPNYKTQLNFAQDLIDAGFPAKNIVVRIDPIIPTPEFLGNSELVLKYILENKMPIRRVRFSLLDQYPHMIQRLKAAEKPNFYPNINGRYQFEPPYEMRRAAIEMLSKYPFLFETCAEDWAATWQPEKFAACGCVSEIDLAILGIKPPENLKQNMQNRTGCHCLSVKAELLNTRAQCPNQCIYCYWKN